MYIVTNRSVDEQQTDIIRTFGDKPAPQGPNELRLVEVKRAKRKWQTRVLPDTITPAMAKEVGLDPKEAHFASAYVARKLLRRMQAKDQRDVCRNLLLFVHGYNNDLKDVLDCAWKLERSFKVEVLVFSWPANGGGVHGLLSYRSDKRDALVSVGALNRVLEKLEQQLYAIHGNYVRDISARANARFPDDAAARDRYLSLAIDKRCPFTINLMLHSMGNYLFKHLLGSSIYNGDRLLFDNVIMAAADTNNARHAAWVNRIQTRNRLYITLNENDIALRASRMKMGENQQARLGHYLRRLDADVATYIDFTNQAYVGNSHAYFAPPALRNARIRYFFTQALNGRVAEDRLQFDPARNLYYFQAASKPQPRSARSLGKERSGLSA